MERVELSLHTNMSQMNGSIEEVKEQLKEIAFNGAYKIYGNPLLKEVADRLNMELDSIIENDFATLYLITQRLVAKANEDDYIVGNRGAVGSSLVAYCIGITETDPIKYNIPFETFAGFNGDKEPDIELNFASEYQPRAEKYVKNIIDEISTYKAGTIGTIANKLKILGIDEFSLLYKLHELTKVNPKDINIYDKEVLKMMCNTDTLGLSEFGTKFAIDLIKKTKPNCFEDFIKISSLLHGTDVWTGNAEVLINNNIATIKEVIASRDDIMNYLIEKGVDRHTSFDIMEFVRKGKANKNTWIEQWQEYKTIMIEHNISNWYIESCEKIKYLFPKAHAVAYTLNAFRFAWYKLYYPEAFFKAYFKVKSNFYAIGDKKHILVSLKKLKEDKEKGKEYSYSRIDDAIYDCEFALEMLDKIDIKKTATKISEILVDSQKVEIKGIVTECFCKETKMGFGMIRFNLTDETGSISCTFFRKSIEEANEIANKINNKKGMIVTGKASFDTFSQTFMVFANKINELWKGRIYGYI